MLLFLQLLILNFHFCRNRHRHLSTDNIALISALLYLQFGTLCEFHRRYPYQSVSNTLLVLSNYAALMFNYLFMFSTLAGNEIDSHSQRTLAQAPRRFGVISEQLVSWTRDFSVIQYKILFSCV